MPIIAKSTGNGSKYLHPEGAFPATCLDLIDLGVVETHYKGKAKQVHKVAVRFWAEQRNKEGEPLYAGERFTLSLGERAALRKFLEAWRGRAFTDEELAGFDLEKLLGAPAYIQVTHKKGADGNVYANITSAMKLPAGFEKPLPLTGYVRVCDRQPEEQESDEDVRAQRWREEDDDLPF